MTEVDDRSTARLHLRQEAAADVPVIIAIQSDPRTNAHRPGGAPSRVESEKTVHEFVRGWQEHGVGYWAVEFDGKLVGVAGVAAPRVPRAGVLEPLLPVRAGRLGQGARRRSRR